jgi:hypothetical protein
MTTFDTTRAGNVDALLAGLVTAELVAAQRAYLDALADRAPEPDVRELDGRAEGLATAVAILAGTSSEVARFHAGIAVEESRARTCHEKARVRTLIAETRLLFPTR